MWFRDISSIFGNESGQDVLRQDIIHLSLQSTTLEPSNGLIEFGLINKIDINNFYVISRYLKVNKCVART